MFIFEINTEINPPEGSFILRNDNYIFYTNESGFTIGDICDTIMDNLDIDGEIGLIINGIPQRYDTIMTSQQSNSFFEFVVYDISFIRDMKMYLMGLGCSDDEVLDWFDNHRSTELFINFENYIIDNEYVNGFINTIMNHQFLSIDRLSLANISFQKSIFDSLKNYRKNKFELTLNINHTFEDNEKSFQLLYDFIAETTHLETLFLFNTLIDPKLFIDSFKYNKSIRYFNYSPLDSDTNEYSLIKLFESETDYFTINERMTETPHFFYDDEMEASGKYPFDSNQFYFSEDLYGPTKFIITKIKHNDIESDSNHV